MDTERTYTFAGTSVYRERTTYRFANDSAARTKMLLSNGHADVVFRELPRAMTLKDAVAWLTAQGIHAELPHGQRRGYNGKRALPAAPAVEVAIEQPAGWDAVETSVADESCAAAAAPMSFGHRMALLRAAKREAAAQG